MAKADFQKSVNMYQAQGVPGAFASINPVTSTPLGYVAGDNVKVGCFVIEDAKNAGHVTGTNTEGAQPIGFIARDIVYPIMTVGDGYSMDVPKGFEVNVQTSGDFWVHVPKAVTKGQFVAVSKTDGSVTEGAATTGATVEGSIVTNFKFMTDAQAGEMAIISNTYLR